MKVLTGPEILNGSIRHVSRIVFIKACIAQDVFRVMVAHAKVCSKVWEWIEPMISTCLAVSAWAVTGESSPERVLKSKKSSLICRRKSLWPLSLSLCS